jgi:hypothetical protein
LHPDPHSPASCHSGIFIVLNIRLRTIC